MCVTGLVATSHDVYAQTHRLQIELLDGIDGAFTSARVRVLGTANSPFLAPDSQLGTHFSQRLGPYVFASDSLVLDLPADDYVVDAVRGTESLSSTATFTLMSDTTITLQLLDWVDAGEWGWWSGDPHVHSDHQQGAFYPRPPLSQVSTAARAEGLEVLYLLDNDPLHPSGPALLAAGENAVIWGEEFRSDFWGHVVLLGLDDLLIGRGYPGCCGVQSPAWPTLSGWLDTGVFPYVHVAHPHSTDDFTSSTDWPQTGFAREAPVLALDSRVHGIAVAGATNAPSIWAVEEYLDGLRTGSRWAAIGEGDRSLDRHVVSPVGQPRTYAQVDSAVTRGSAQSDVAWRDAILAGRSFASTGPVFTEFTVNGLAMGATTSIAGPGMVTVHVGFRSKGRMQSLTLHGATGEHLQWSWPLGRTSLDTTVTVSVLHDELFVCDVAGGGADWPELEFAPRAVSSPVWVDTGAPWPVPPPAPRRSVERLQQFWSDIFDDRYFESSADSQAAADDVLGAVATYEAMVDDAAPPFALHGPVDQSTISLSLFTLSWGRVVSFDGESVSYSVEISESPDFGTLAFSSSVVDTSVGISGLARGRNYYWRVFALETGDPPVIASNAPFRFFLTSIAVANAPQTREFSVSTPGASQLRLSVPTAGAVQIRIFDSRGRLLRVLDREWVPAGSSEVRWDGRDRAGRPVARGIYRVLATHRGRNATAALKVLD